MKILIWIILSTVSLTGQAENKKYEYCIVWGVAGAANDSFIQNLVDRILVKKNR